MGINLEFVRTECALRRWRRRAVAHRAACATVDMLATPERIWPAIHRR